ncbi:MAG: hypothetical protein JXN59_00615 [Anaerolineae bacterium]|nr:hypothetical protein [Anaerolineae bacterium]
MSGPRHETITQSSFPDLRILAVEDLLPHEEHDIQRSAPLIARLKQATHWLNPPIAAPIASSGQFVVLDGANRHYCLAALGYQHILVQVVDYESAAVTLQTWHHAVRGIEIVDFLPPLFAVEGVQVQETSLLNARAGLASRKLLGYIVMRDTRVFSLRQQDMTVSRTTLLRKLVDTYRFTGKVSRITHDEFAGIQQNYPDVLALVVFPRYEPAEIMVAARDGDLLPPGITRHIIAGRALRLNYPMADLQYDNLSLQEKNDRLQHWIQERLAAKNVRYYAEPTFVFDE